MGSEIELKEGLDVALLESCSPELQVRHFENSLYNPGETEAKFIVPQIEYAPLNPELPEVRLLKLHPTENLSKHVRCDLEIHSVSRLPCFIAIQNARGYRKMEEAIEIMYDRQRYALVISAALERFLRYLRTRIQEPTYIWVRYACLLEFHLQEQRTYWTREFSDKMYAAASRVFDMHATNSSLIENGYFERFVAPGYAKWKKEWYGQPDEIVLPRVCPIRLGTRPDNESPTMGYQYMPLDMIADEVRILCVMPVEDMTAPIVMHVAHCPIKCEVNFIALSYQWGTDLSPEQVILNGQTKTIRKNLADAIRFLRMKQAIVPLWIDALSINQEDMAERSRQVRRMGEIYDNAMSVYAWAGLRSDDTEEALHLMAELYKHPVVKFNEKGEFKLDIEPSRLARMCSSLYKFFARPYFRRMWILQEIALASNPTVFAGCKRAVTFDTLDTAAYHLHHMLTNHPTFVAQILNTDDSLNDLDVSALAFARKIFYFRYLVSGGLGGGSLLGLFHKIPKHSPGYLDTLVLARDFDCTDPRDRIYSLWNLAQDKTGLKFSPEYSKPYNRVYTEFAKAWASQHRSLDILGAVEATCESAPFYSTAPSWSPNWNTQATASSLIRKDYLPARFMSAMHDQSGRLYSADGLNDGKRQFFSFEGSILYCTGLIIDDVDFMLDNAPDLPAGPLTSIWRFNFWTDKLQQLCHNYDASPYDDPDRAICAMLHGDCIDAWPKLMDSGYDLDECYPDERYVCLPAKSRHVLPFAKSYDRSEAWSVVDAVLRGRRPFVTQSGFIGLGPAYIAEADDCDARKTTAWHLAVVAGCSVPLLLRKKEDETYELAGSCFVQGWMDGEWIEMITGTSNSAEAWDLMRDGAQLVIS